MDLRVALGRLGDYRFPAFKLRHGQSVELVLPEGWSEEDTRRLRAALEAIAGAGKRRLAWAEALEGRGSSWWDRFRRVTLARAVAEALRQPLEAGREVCQRCGVEPEQRLDVTEATERKLLEFEVAAELADLVVIDDRGMSFAGRRRLAEHLRAALRSGRFSVLVLSYPYVTGNPRRTEHGEPWADVRIMGTRMGRDFWLELSFYLRSLDRYRVHVSDSDTMPVTWHRVTAFTEERIQTEDGVSLAPESVRRYAASYPNRVLTTMVPDDSQPLPPGARFQPDGEPPDSEFLQESQLESGRFHVRIDFAASGPKPHDANHFTTTFTNFGASRVRVLRFGAYRKTGKGYVLHTITGGFFTGEDFVNWYAAPTDGWIAPGQSVSDPANYGDASILWVYFCETEEGDRFIASGIPAEVRK